MKFVKPFLTLSITALLIVAGASSATASQSTATLSAQLDASCVAQVEALTLSAAEKSAALEFCTVSRGGTVSAPTAVTTAQIVADTSLSKTDKDELLVASAAAAISSRTWSQFTTGGGYTVTHGGKFYYNGTRVWATVTYSGYTGSHNCATNYAIALVINQGSCSESGSTTSRTMYNSWTVNWVVNNSPLSYGVNMTATLSKTGAVAGYGTTWS